MVKNKLISPVLISLSIVLLLLPGCQLTQNKAINSTNYGQYYLSLQHLSEQQLSAEIQKHQFSLSQPQQENSPNKYDLQIKMLLLYSLPKSPIYNTFNAKALLNQMQQDGDNAALAHIDHNDQAFITLLRDQLNQRLLMRNRLLEQQKTQKQQASQLQQQLIEQVSLLEQTIKQLKNIEQTIDNRDQ